MNDFMNGFIRALSMPNSAQHLYEAGVALDRWLGESGHRQEFMNILKANSASGPGKEGQERFDYDGPVFGRQSDPYGRGGFPDGRSGQPGLRGNGSDGNGSFGKRPYGRDAELSPEGEREIDKMMREVEDDLIDILNRGNPDPNANRPGAPRRVPFFMRDPARRRMSPGNPPSYRDNP